LKTFLASVLGGLVAMVLFSFLAFLFVAGIIGAVASNFSSSQSASEGSGAIVLEIDLRTPLSDQPATAGPAAIFSQGAFTDVLLKLDSAASDSNVKGVFVRASELGVGNSRAEELRTSFLKLRENGKFIIAHTQGFLGTGPSAFRSISAADEIWLQPGSDIIVPGMTTETLFMKDLFDNLSVSAEIEAFYEYKNAPNVYKETDYTEPHREAMTELVSDIWTISVEDIAADRGFADVASLRALLESGPISSDEALDAGLVTRLDWPEDAREAALEKAGEGATIKSISRYEIKPSSDNAPLIAIVGGEGSIVTGSATPGPFGGDAIFSSDRVSKALLDAGRDENVKAVVFRVDSGGGSAIASDQIWHAVDRVRNEMNKPVVVSMGGAAASGGYYVSAGADSILALRTTITGSIGVFGGKYAIADGLRQIGINPSAISVGGEFASAFTLDSFTETQRELLHESLERTYDRFMRIVAEGREIDETRVREIARGRVWSGEDAAAINLVNETGGLIAAIEKAKEFADIPADSEVAISYFPTPRRGFEDFIAQFFGASAETSEAAARFNALMEDETFRAFMDQASALQTRQTQMRAPVVIEN